MDKNQESGEAECRGCSDLKTAVYWQTRHLEVALEYLNILEEISTKLETLQLPGWTELPHQILLQGLKNNVQDPREMIDHLVEVCSNSIIISPQSVPAGKLPELMNTLIDEDLNTRTTEMNASWENLLALLKTKTKEKAKLKYDYKELNIVHTKVKEEYKNLEKEHAKVEHEFKNLKKEHTQVEEEYKNLQKEHAKVENEYKNLQIEHAKILKEIEDEQKKVNDIRQWSQNKVPSTCVVPKSASDDERITPVLHQFMQLINSHMGHTVHVENTHGPDINLSVNSPIILPCVAASRVGSDISAALNKANIANGRVILIIFHHLASHNSRIHTPTERRLSDRTLLDQCVGMVDAVFWNGSMYDCEANRVAIQRVMELWRWQISLSDVQELNLLH